ncbi:DUF3445 domain-containing protein [uncultured Roseibium sp.]|uniref:heme-dependent oxidative N-demethylase family protein n=1 Tax=uncultured Roseibium sp. TaxID=1936171 RepID=UPI00261E0825|nr:DUF3445 domain-containing protein [uncultured Roseibium sp.]
MPSPANPRFRHRPYDGSTQPFTVGLRPVDEDDWLEPDPFLAEHLNEKERLFAQDLSAVFRAEDDTEASQGEVLELVTGHLSRFHNATHVFDGDTVSVGQPGIQVDLKTAPFLLTASRLVQEDLVIMRSGPEGYRLVAASLCFPSSWRLSEKIGLTMTGIHNGVPDFNDARMGQVVARLFENLKVGQLLCRFNWSIYPDDKLHHPMPEGIPFDVTSQTFASLFLRVERQTLRRLPESGDILFTIKIHHDPLSLLARQEDRIAIASNLRTQLLALRSDQLIYKGLAKARDEIAAVLLRM